MSNPYIEHTSKTLLEAGTRSSKVDPTVMQAYDWKRLALLMQLNLDDRLKETRKRRGSKNKNRKRGREALKGLFGGGE